MLPERKDQAAVVSKSKRGGHNQTPPRQQEGDQAAGKVRNIPQGRTPSDKGKRSLARTKSSMSEDLTTFDELKDHTAVVMQRALRPLSSKLSLAAGREKAGTPQHASEELSRRGAGGRRNALGGDNASLLDPGRTTTSDSENKNPWEFARAYFEQPKADCSGTTAEEKQEKQKQEKQETMREIYMKMNDDRVFFGLPCTDGESIHHDIPLRMLDRLKIKGLLDSRIELAA